MKNILLHLLLITSSLMYFSCSDDSGACDGEDYIGTVTGSFGGDATCEVYPTSFELQLSSNNNNELIGIVNGSPFYRVILNGQGARGCTIQVKNDDTNDVDFGSITGIIDGRDISMTLVFVGQEVECSFVGTITN